MPVDPEIAVLLEFLAAAGGKPMWEGTADEARQSFRALAVDLRDASLLPVMESVEDIRVAGGAGDLDARVYRPGGDGPLPTIVLLHGGGWVIGDLDTHDLTARTLADLCSAVVVSVAYRLAPEHPFPAAADDAIASTRWVHEHLEELGGDDRLAVAGDSAGGNLAAVVAQTFRDEGILLRGQLLIYPGVDLAETDEATYPSRTENATGYFLDVETMRWFVGAYASGLSPEQLGDAKVSPLHGQLSGLAPAVVLTGELDPLRDEGEAYAHALEAAGVPTQLRRYDGMIHGFVDMGRYSKAAQAAIEEGFTLFRDVLHGVPA